MIRTYSELITYNTFEERLNYLKLHSSVGIDTFGFDRIFNQTFYQKSYEWKRARNIVISRDMGKDLGLIEVGKDERLIIHHMNPITLDDIQNGTEFLLDPEYLITTILNTHNKIHYDISDANSLPTVTERFPNDMSPWRNL